MTTAARPTFDPARGGSQRGEKRLSALSTQFSSRDLPAHLTLKERKPGQGTQDELKRKDLKFELEQREKIAILEKGKANLPSYLPSLEYATQIRLAIKAEKLREKEEKELETIRELNPEQNSQNLGEEKSDDHNHDDASPQDSLSCLSPANLRAFAQLDADEDLGNGDFDEDDLEEDDPKELLAELNRIKQERAAEEEKRKAEEKLREEKIRMENILAGNPLLNQHKQQGDSFRIKRRWDDDVVFKNCAKGEPDSKKRPYVNDTLRQEFHKRFMEKYIQ